MHLVKIKTSRALTNVLCSFWNSLVKLGPARLKVSIETVLCLFLSLSMSDKSLVYLSSPSHADGQVGAYATNRPLLTFMWAHVFEGEKRFGEMGISLAALASQLIPRLLVMLLTDRSSLFSLKSILPLSGGRSGRMKSHILL